MPLTLVTGPANAAKAGEVLGGLRARLEQDPILVVPAFQDVEHAQRELADRGAVFGARVLRFEWLFREIAFRADLSQRPASDVQRELVVEEAVRRARLQVLADSAAQPGFVRAATRFVAEVRRYDRDAALDPGRFARAMRAWAGGGPRRPYADDLVAIYSGYHEGLAAAGLLDAEALAWQSLDALRAEPARWEGTPLFVYGFDDFDALQLDALDTIANHCHADVTVSLPWEPGRAAFKAVAPIHGELLSRAGDRAARCRRSTTTTRRSRAPRSTTSSGTCSGEGGERVEAGEAISLHSAAGRRAEVELAGARVLELLRAGVEPGDVAVVFRRPEEYASLLEQVFGAYGIPFSIDRRVPLGHTGLGRGLLALVRCAARRDASADDLLAWLRTPGLLKEPGLADRLEAKLRRDGAHSAVQARAAWESEHWKLDDLDRLAEARRPADFLAELERQLGRLFAGPYRRQAAVLRGPELEDPRVYTAARQALAELRAVVEADPRTRLDPERVLAVLEELEVHLGEPPQPDRVQVAKPEAIRARRFEAVFVCGLQEGEFPSGSSPEPFLPDEDRRAVAREGGLRLPVREDRLERERYLFYTCCSRAERLLVLSSRSSDEEGNPQAESFFVEDVRDLLLPGAEVRTRSLSEVTWRPEDAPTAAELERALAASGAAPRGGRCRAADRAQPAAGAAGRAGGGVRGRARALRRLPGQVAGGGRPAARASWCPTPRRWCAATTPTRCWSAPIERLREETGERRVTPANLGRRGADRCWRSCAPAPVEFPLSPKQTRVRAAARRLEFDLLRFLRREAERGRRASSPSTSSCAFGYGRGRASRSRSPTACSVRGRIDRVDTSDGMALVLDYKSGKRVDPTRSRAGSPRTASRRRSTCSSWSGCSGCAPRAACTCRSASASRARAGWSRRTSSELGSGFVGNDRLGAGRVPREARLGARAGCARPTPRCAAASCAATPTRAPGTAAARTRRSAGARREPDARAGARGRAPGPLADRAGRRRHRQDDRAGRALRAGGGRGRRGGRERPRDHVHREGGGRDEGARAARASSSWAVATRLAPPRAPGSRPSTASARACCARTR